MSNPVFELAVLALIIWCSELLAKKGWGKNLGTALIVILIAAVLANLNIIPSASNTIPLYSGIFKYLAPLSIFFLLLGVNLKELFGQGRTVLGKSLADVAMLSREQILAELPQVGPAHVLLEEVRGTYG